jgi:hypothetical protein
MAYNVLKGNVQFINSTSGSIESMVDDHSNQTIAGIKTFSGMLTASTGVSSSVYHGNGAALTGLDVAVNTYSSASNNRVLTSVNSDTIQGESNLTFDGSLLTIAGNVTASANISGSGFYGSAVGLRNIPVDQFAANISAADLSLGNGVENNSGNLLAKISGSSGLSLSSAGLGVDPNSAFSIGSLAAADEFLVADNNASNALRKATITNLQSYMQSSLTFGGAAGSNTQVQFADGAGSFAASSNLTFNSTANVLTVTGQLSASTLVSSSQIFATSFHGDGSSLTGLATNVYNSFTANYTVATTHDLMGIVTTGSAITASLAAASTYGPGQRFTFKDVSGSCSGSNHIVISASAYSSAGDRIDGQGILKIEAGFGAVTLASDGVASFFIVSTS